MLFPVEKRMHQKDDVERDVAIAIKYVVSSQFKVEQEKNVFSM